MKTSTSSRKYPPNSIGRLRRQRRWTQYDLEFASGISQSRLSLIERGIRPLTEADSVALGAALGVEPEALVGEVPAAG